MALRDRLASFLGRRADTFDGPRAWMMPGVRGDAATYSGSAVSNALTNLGTARDSGSNARPNVQRDHLSMDELTALLRGGVYRRIVGLHPQWTTVKGWRLTDDTEDEEPLAEYMERLQVVQAFRQADTWARAFGEARIWLQVDDGLDAREPLDIRRVRRLHRLEVLDRREFSVAEFNVDPFVAPLGEPVLYSVHPRRSGVAAAIKVVHASRLLRFYGDELPPSDAGYVHTDGCGWGADAVGQTLWDGIRNMAQTGSAGARLAQELSVAVFNVRPPKSTSDQASAAMAQFRTMNLMKSVANAIFLAPDEQYQRVSANPTGFKDLSDAARTELALLIGVPLALLIGEAPSGLNTDGSSWQAMWYQDVESRWRQKYRPGLRTIAEIGYLTEGRGRPKRWDIEFIPLGNQTALDRAQVRLAHTQADQLAIMQGILTADEARGRYTVPGGFQQELQVVEQAVAEEEPPAPDVEEARRQVEERLARGDGFDREFRARRFAVPSGAQGNASKVLAWREEHGDRVQGMTATGWRRARQLAGEETVSGDDLIEIAAWFARHAGNEEIAPEHQDEPWRDAGHVAWLGWGGDTMRTMARERVEANRQ